MRNCRTCFKQKTFATNWPKQLSVELTIICKGLIVDNILGPLQDMQICFVISHISAACLDI